MRLCCESECSFFSHQLWPLLFVMEMAYDVRLLRICLIVMAAVVVGDWAIWVEVVRKQKGS